MTREELLERVKKHEESCLRGKLTANFIFMIEEIMELADGVFSIKEVDGDFVIYFDREKCQFRKENTCEDLGLMIPNFSKDTGFFHDSTARDWGRNYEVAVIALELNGGGEIAWHDEPIPLDYKTSLCV